MVAPEERNCAHEQKERTTLDLSKLVSDLEMERDRLGQAIAALLGSALVKGHVTGRQQAHRQAQGQHDEEKEARRNHA